MNSFTCKANKQSRFPPELQRASIFFLCIWFALASASVLRWNGTLRMVPVVFVAGLAYLIIFLITEFADCVDKVQEGYPRVQREALTQAIMFMLLDLCIIVTILYGLGNTMWRFRREITRGFGTDSTGRWCVTPLRRCALELRR